MAADLMWMMNRNTVKPDKLILIDDSDHGMTIPDVDYEVEYTRTPRIVGEWPGVNGFWNYGAVALREFDYVSFLNDDILIHPRFFELIMRAMGHQVGIACPRLGEKSEVGFSGPCLNLRVIQKREGIAFTIRGDVLSQIPPIPKELLLYFGDDWYFGWAQKLGYLCCRAENNVIYHYGQTSTRQRGLRERLKPERVMFEREARKYQLPIWWKHDRHNDDGHEKAGTHREDSSIIQGQDAVGCPLSPDHQYRSGGG
jgi:glycosyltransferase involved in cell wall biosynthesis